jgi:hypothetical protein
MKTLIALFAAASFTVSASAALAQDEKKAEEAKASPDKKPAAPVVEIKRTGPPPCIVKPVMTDAEIEVCKKAGYAPRPKPGSPELAR